MSAVSSSATWRSFVLVLTATCLWLFPARRPSYSLTACSYSGAPARHRAFNVNLRKRMPEEINHHRRRFLRTAATSIAAASLGVVRSSGAQSSKTQVIDLTPIKPRSNTSFDSLKQIDAGLLNVGYAEAGPTNGPAV